MHRPMLCAALIVIVAAPVNAAPAPPLTPQGLGPVHIGMTRKQAERALSARLDIVYGDGNICGQGGRADKRDPDVWYLFENGHLARIDIDRPQRDGRFIPHVTAAGLHIGSAESDIAKAYGPVVTEPHPYVATGHYVRVYPHGKSSGFIFETDHGKVTSFRAGLYPALGYSEGCA